MANLVTTINYLPSWKNATSPDDPPPLRTIASDETVHFSDLKKIAKSGQQYLHAVNTPFEPTRAMLIGTAVHFLTLGGRPGAKPVVFFDGDARRGKAWEAFRAENEDSEILTAPEWQEALAVVDSLREDPIAQARLKNARCEVPLAWEEGGLKMSTSGVDILTSRDELGDLKTTSTVEPEAWTRLAFRMGYPQQLAFYRRGARANGIACNGGLFLLGVETSAPFEVVDLDLTEGMIDYAEKLVSMWLERLRVYRDACPRPRRVKDWPGYAQTPVPMQVPSWLREDEDDAG